MADHFTISFGKITIKIPKRTLPKGPAGSPQLDVRKYLKDNNPDLIDDYDQHIAESNKFGNTLDNWFKNGKL